MDSPAARVNALALRQQGVIFHEQALRLGLSAKQIKTWVATGRWRRLHRGVYAVGHAPLSDLGRALAAVFGCGPGALLSHRSAAGLWALQGMPTGRPHVTCPVPRARREGIVVHRSRRLTSAEGTLRRGIPVTTLPRTIVDLAEVGTEQEVERCVRSAERLHGFDRTVLEPIPGRRGTRRLRSPAHFTRGHLERRLLEVLRRFGLALPEMNVRRHGIELDAVWWEAGIVLELDDWASHRDREAFIRDRKRDRRHHVAGLRPIRATYEDLTVDVEAFVAELAQLGVPPAAAARGGGRG